SRAQEGRILGCQDVQGDRAREGEVDATGHQGTGRVSLGAAGAALTARAQPGSPRGGGPTCGKGFPMPRQATFLAAALAALSGCATFVHGPYQDVVIDSNPPGAQAKENRQGC